MAKIAKVGFYIKHFTIATFIKIYINIFSLPHNDIYLG